MLKLRQIAVQTVQAESEELWFISAKGRRAVAPGARSSTTVIPWRHHRRRPDLDHDGTRQHEAPGAATRRRHTRAPLADRRARARPVAGRDLPRSPRPKGTRRSGMRPGHFDLGFVLAGMTVACLVGRRPGGRDLPVVDPGPLYRLAKATRAAFYVLSPVMVGLGIASAFVRGVSLGPISLPQVRDPGWRRSPTHSHRLTANVLMALALFQAVAALVHHYLRHDAVLRRMLPRGS